MTTHPNRKEGSTQKDRLYSLLKDGKWHTTIEIAKRVYGVNHAGICRVAARVNDLRKEKFSILSRCKKNAIWEYRME
jgi:hypothetical protein